MFRVVFYVALGNTHPQTNRIFLIILLRMYRIHFCISPTFEGVKVNILRRKLGQAGFKSNLSLVCQVICQNTSGMVYYTILGVIHLHLLLLDYPQCIIATLLLLESWVVCIIMTIQFSSWHRHLLCTILILPFAAALSAVGARWRLLHFVVYYLQDSQHTPLRGYT